MNIVSTKHPLNIAREDVMSGGYVKETYRRLWAYETTENFEDCVIKASSIEVLTVTLLAPLQE